jgi:hypothetical protein
MPALPLIALLAADLVYGAPPPVRACDDAAYPPAPAAWPPVPGPLAFIGPVPAPVTRAPGTPPPLPRAPGTNTWLMERREAFIRRAAAHVRAQGRAPTPVEWPIDKLPLLP